MEYDDERILNKLDSIESRLTAIEVSVANLRGQLEGSGFTKTGAPIQAVESSTIQALSSKNSAITMAIAGLIGAVTSVLTSVVGGK